MTEKTETPQTISYSEINLKDKPTITAIQEIEDAIIERQDIVVLWPNAPLFTLGAKTKNKLVGVTQVSKDGHVNYIVHPDFQGKGIATNLLSLAIIRAKEQDVPNLAASVQSDSISERTLLKAGFLKMGQDNDISYYSLHLLPK